ncbi:unnamed protein product [Schistosoma curassoni]|uniref:Reverse transcriptase domain-containing protein n=1 Tax=Schistosoma curassoni TaxID=6186 RepID=A0A183L1T5_9TREM|nr:unnamed protein product [Schistosoma curassoni]
MKHHHKEWITIEKLDKIKERKNKKTAINNSRTRAENIQAQTEYIEVKKQVKKSIKADKRKYVEELATMVEKAATEGSMKRLYDSTKKLAGRYSKSKRQVKDKEGRSITEIQQQWNRWTEYSEELLNKPAPMNPPDIEPAHTDLSIYVNPPTTEEIRMASRQIKSAKAAGLDNIPAEALKSDIEVTTNMLHLIFKIIVEQSVEWNSSLYINFNDYEKALDSVHKRTLWKLLRHYGVPEKIVSIIRNSYDGLQCKVVHGGQLTDALQIRTGIRQGCLLLSFLSPLVVDWIMKTSTSEGKHGIQWTDQNQLDDLDFHRLPSPPNPYTRQV